MRWPAQARVGIWDGHTRFRRPSTTSLHNREASTISVITGQGHGVRLKREEDAATSLGCVIGSNVRLARGFAPRFVRSYVAHSFFTEDRRWHDNEDDDGPHQRSSVRLARGCALAQFAPASLTSTPPGTGTGMETEEAARQCTAIAMILKSRAHTATRKLRRRGCYGSTSFTKLHDAQMTVHTLTTTQPFSLVAVRASLHGWPC